jgi:hypothetical protein
LPEIIVTCKTSSFYFSSVNTHITSLFSQFFFFLSSRHLVPPSFLFLIFQAATMDPKEEKNQKKKKTKSGEDEKVWRGLAKPTLWSPSLAPRVTFSGVGV